MERQEVLQNLVDIIASELPNLKVPVGGVTEQTKFHEDMGADSLDMAELTMSCENVFNIDIKEDFEPGNVGEAIKEIIRLLEKQK